MDVRYIAWAGYQFEWTSQITGVSAPEFESEEIGEMFIKSRDVTTNANIKGKSVKPKLTAFPNPVV
jgi:hypothetical protein